MHVAVASESSASDDLARTDSRSRRGGIDPPTAPDGGFLEQAVMPVVTGSPALFRM